MNYKIIAKYLKDLKFEISNPKIFFELTKNISNYKIKIDIKSNQFKEKIIEVETCLSLEAAKEGFDKINTKIVHCTIIELDGNIKNKKELEEVILIKVPTEIYSDIRETFIMLFEKSGFKEIKIDKNVDFEKLYKQKTIQ
jgi:preprotein translocase subunit SecB